MTCLGKGRNGCLGMVHVPCLAYDSTNAIPPHSHTPKEQSGTPQKQVRGALFQRKAYKHMNLWGAPCPGHCFISSPSPNQNLLTPLPSSTPNEQPHLGNSHKGWIVGASYAVYKGSESYSQQYSIKWTSCLMLGFKNAGLEHPESPQQCSEALEYSARIELGSCICPNHTAISLASHQVFLNSFPLLLLSACCIMEKQLPLQGGKLSEGFFLPQHNKHPTNVRARKD